MAVFRGARQKKLCDIFELRDAGKNGAKWESNPLGTVIAYRMRV